MGVLYSETRISAPGTRRPSRKMNELLFTPRRIGNVQIPNRTVFLAHETGFAEDGLPTERDAAYYEARARGGAGLIMGPSSMLVHPTASNPTYASGYDPAVIPRLEEIAEAVHRHDSKVFAQLQHTGGEDTGEHAMHETWAPSAVPSNFGYEMPKRMEKSDIEEVKLGYAKTAEHVKRSGIDGIELKVGHDGLLRQFISPKYNRRSDEYGGDVDGRVRLLNEVIEVIRDRVGEDFPVGVRLTLDEMESGGYDYDYAVAVMRRLHPSVDFLDSDIATISKLYVTDAPMHAPLGYTEEYYGDARSILDVPVIAAGRINDLTKAEDLLQEGKADFIGMCRQLIADPETVRKAERGNDSEITHCIACNQNCLGGLNTKGHIGCIQTPRSGRETEMDRLVDLPEVDDPKEVLVVGGGPAGMSFAVTAADLGHHVTIHEKRAELGGQVNIATNIEARREFGDVVRNLENRLRTRDVSVETGSQVSPQDVDGGWDVVVAATGATEQSPDLPGEDVYRSWDVLQGESVGDSVVVFDQNKHATGVGVAEQLAKEGHDVTIVTTSYHPGDQLEGSNVPPFLESLVDLNIETKEHATVVGYEDKLVQAMNVYSQEIESIEADSLVVANRRQARDDFAHQLRDQVDIPVHSIGDSVAPRLVDKAIYDGETLAREL
ncbi:oxidoreductase [Halodesulfurarchaeum formicicum]|uniref:NADH:flavin oxidoreductase/NADH oxidase n=1 Tax=Halodesulfurarchaeum formicicum TaxID=1873524 RepID=A0A1J1AAC8_9EURY|nr:FAD-dependent oxidoreductase [Halodesulfurarchaeum formicicum]APE94679.1 NADH:flavin oxidoreductase/NADH oxidase [Halodesulfurarchaeum formicicum]